jgi:hypothetical protein
MALFDCLILFSTTGDILGQHWTEIFVSGGVKMLKSGVLKMLVFDCCFPPSQKHF